MATIRTQYYIDYSVQQKPFGLVDYWVSFLMPTKSYLPAVESTNEGYKKPKISPLLTMWPDV